MTTMASQITSLKVVYSIVYSGADQRKNLSSASLAFVRGIHRDRWIPRTNGPVTRKMLPFEDVIMVIGITMQVDMVPWNHLRYWPDGFPSQNVSQAELWYFLWCWTNEWICWLFKMPWRSSEVTVMDFGVVSVPFWPDTLKPPTQWEFPVTTPAWGHSCNQLTHHGVAEDKT